MGISSSYRHLQLKTGYGCELELLSALGPKYDFERLGCKLVGSPRHADILIVTGSITKKARERFARIYNQTPEPKVVLAIGACPLSGGVFAGSEQVDPPVDKHVKADIYVPGCPPKPEAIIDGLKKALGKLKETSLKGK